MEPVKWGNEIVRALEEGAVVGSLLPRGAVEPGDRYQPCRVFAEYVWTGPTSASTRVQFKVPKPKERDPVDIKVGTWHATTSSDEADWGPDWELVVVSSPPGPADARNEEFHAPGRFHIRLIIGDEHIHEDTYRRRIVLENLRETGGVLHAVRVIQQNLPHLERARPYGIDEDIYYRAGGLIGTFSDEQRTLSFAPYALLPEPVRTPLPGPSLAEATVQGVISESISRLLASRGFKFLWQFQVDSIRALKRWMDVGSEGQAILLTSGTAAGKTEAFLVPLFERLKDDVAVKGVAGLFIYPTKALEADQARRFFEYLAYYNKERTNHISIGVLDGDTPFNRITLTQMEERGEFRSPFGECPFCAGRVRFTKDEHGNALVSPTCSKCLESFPWIRVERESIRDFWPNILLTVPDMLHRLMSGKFAWMSHSMLGRSVHLCSQCGRYTPSTHNTLAGTRTCKTPCGKALSEPLSLGPALVVFDEAHMYKGLFGSQVGILIARLKRLTALYGRSPVFVGASATIAAPADFGRQLFGGDILVVRGEERIRPDVSPRRYHLFVMPVQVTVLNAVGHVIAAYFGADVRAHERNRLLIFSDSKRTVYQLQASLPEFYSTLSQDVLPRANDAVTRSHTADHSPEERRRIEIAFDRGDIRVLLATQTLEVGVDFKNLQLELQTGATYSYNDYIQRVGRAGRKGVSALVICVLRPQVPLDYYYFEHCRELVQFSPETLDELPLRTDNPFLVARHSAAAIQDYLVSKEPGARLMWDVRGAMRVLTEERDETVAYLQSVFVREHSWDSDLIQTALTTGVDRAHSVLASPTGTGQTAERLESIIELSIRATDAPVDIESDDFAAHHGISLAGELEDENEEVEDNGERQEGEDEH